MFSSAYPKLQGEFPCNSLSSDFLNFLGIGTWHEVRESKEKILNNNVPNVNFLQMLHQHLLLVLFFTTLLESSLNSSAVPTLIYIGGNFSNEPKRELNKGLFSDNYG